MQLPTSLVKSQSCFALILNDKIYFDLLEPTSFFAFVNFLHYEILSYRGAYAVFLQALLSPKAVLA